MEMQKIRAFTISIEVFGNKDEVYGDIRIETEDINYFISQVMQNGFIIANEEGVIRGLSPSMIARVIAEPHDDNFLMFDSFHSKN